MSGELAAHLDPKGPAAEAFRVLRTNLQFMGLDAPLKSLLVTRPLSVGRALLELGRVTRQRS